MGFLDKEALFIVAFIFCLFFRRLWFDDKSQGWVVGEITPHPIYKNAEFNLQMQQNSD